MTACGFSKNFVKKTRCFRIVVQMQEEIVFLIRVIRGCKGGSGGIPLIILKGICNEEVGREDKGDG
jgi:hypothetical protein